MEGERRTGEVKYDKYRKKGRSKFKKWLRDTSFNFPSSCTSFNAVSFLLCPKEKRDLVPFSFFIYPGMWDVLTADFHWKCTAQSPPLPHPRVSLSLSFVCICAGLHSFICVINWPSLTQMQVAAKRKPEVPAKLQGNSQTIPDVTWSRYIILKQISRT